MQVIQDTSHLLDVLHDTWEENTHPGLMSYTDPSKR